MSARYSSRSNKTSTGALGAAAGKSLLLLNPVTDGVNITELWVSFGALVAQTDIAVELYRVVTAGSLAGSAGTIVKDNPNSAAATTTSQITITTEATTIEVLREAFLTTQGGLLVAYFPLGREPYGAPAGQKLGVRVFNDGSGTMTAVDARCSMVFEEE